MNGEGWGGEARNVQPATRRKMVPDSIPCEKRLSTPFLGPWSSRFEIQSSLSMLEVYGD
jgi:hypothetical protein